MIATPFRLSTRFSVTKTIQSLPNSKLGHCQAGGLGDKVTEPVLQFQEFDGDVTGARA